MRISDWSSDVCSSDLLAEFLMLVGDPLQPARRLAQQRQAAFRSFEQLTGGRDIVGEPGALLHVGAQLCELFLLARLLCELRQLLDGVPEIVAVARSSEERRVGKAWVSTCRSRGA